MKTFVPAPRYTEADELNERNSLQCKLQETLVWLVKKEKDSPSWEPPFAEVMFDTNETLQLVYEGNLHIHIRIHVIELVVSACKRRHWNMLSYFFFLTSQVASSGLCQTCGTELHVQFLSNAPIAVMKNHNNKSNKAS